MARATVIYDSTVDDFTDKRLFQMLKGKKHIAIIATTTRGDVFGGYYSVAVTKQKISFWDPNVFIFTFVSRWRCTTPKKCDVKESKKARAFIEFFKDDSSGWFVSFSGGDGLLFLGNEKSRTFCLDLYQGFENIENTTQTPTVMKYFICCRIVAIQLE